MAFKPSHGDKREAVALLGRALEAQGWKILGRHEDQSDMTTDYYSPESWDGVAVLGDAVACVDVSSWRLDRAGKDEIRVKYEDGPTCARCAGTGEEPGGWTLENAQARPRQHHVSKLLRENPGSTPMLGDGNLGCGVVLPTGSRMSVMLADVVSPIPFEGGREHCFECHGNKTQKIRRESVAFTWPTFQANPRNATWHVERGGRIVAQGTGVFSLLRAPDGVEVEWSRRDEARRERFAQLAKKITAAAQGAPAIETAEPAACVGGVEVRASDFPGNVELVFPAKPAEDVRDELKAAGFRWSGRNGCWYGKAARLPERYKETAPATA